jgi:hypothetical protein
MSIRIVISVFFISLLAACSQDDATKLNIKNPKIKQALENRKKLYAVEILSNCRKDVLDKASAYVDSMISADLDFRLNDSIIFPERPLRPNWPGDIIVPDTIKARPIKTVKKG